MIHPKIRSAVETFDLTNRETDIVKTLMFSHTTSSVAKKLNISPATVYAHLRSIFAKCGVNNRLELMMLVMNQIVREIEEDDSCEMRLNA